MLLRTQPSTLQTTVNFFSFFPFYCYDTKCVLLAMTIAGFVKLRTGKVLKNKAWKVVLGVSVLDTNNLIMKILRLQTC
jgi:hypothetical protein